MHLHVVTVQPGLPLEFAPQFVLEGGRAAGFKVPRSRILSSSSRLGSRQSVTPANVAVFLRSQKPETPKRCDAYACVSPDARTRAPPADGGADDGDDHDGRNDHAADGDSVADRRRMGGPPVGACLDRLHGGGAAWTAHQRGR